MTDDATPLTFATSSGSLYEIDVVHRRVRRVTGAHPPTARQGDDGTWRVYALAALLEHADRAQHSVLFDWTGAGHCTITSPLVPEHVPSVRAALGVTVIVADLPAAPEHPEPAGGT